MPEPKKSWAEIQAELNARKQAAAEARKAEADKAWDKKYAEEQKRLRAERKQSGQPKTPKVKRNTANRKDIDSRGRVRKTMLSRKGAERPSFNRRTQNLFSERLTSRTGWAKDWAKPLALRAQTKTDGGFFGWSRRNGGGTTTWGAHVKKQGRNISGGFVLNGSKDWIRQLKVAEHQLVTNAERWRVVFGQRALKVFQESFKYQKFYSAGESRWQELSEFTKRKRAHKKPPTWPGKILVDTGSLLSSLKAPEGQGGPNGMHRISTSDVTYGGYHNDPKRNARYHKFGKGSGYGKLMVKRKFMGHSTYLHEFAWKYMDRYFLDDVFLAKRV